jgi:sugar lactone lactonase YvrE
MKKTITLSVFAFCLNTNAQIITTVCGNGTSAYTGDGGQATAAELAAPLQAIFDATGNMYIADADNNVIRKVTTTGIISTVAGNGTGGYSGDGGAATAAEMNYPQGIVFDAAGNLYISDAGRIRKVVLSTGIITTFAGDGTGNYGGDGGQATAAGLDPIGLTIDTHGNMYVADWNNQRIRKINTSGIISTVAGTGTFGFSGDGGQATAAELFYPGEVVIDATGNLYISDEVNMRIRKVSAPGIITTIAGNGTQGYSGDGGLAINAELYQPTGLALDASGNLYIADELSNRIRKVTTSGIITTIAGNGTQSYSGDGGQATAAELNYPGGVSFDAAGNLYIADSDNYRIRKVTNVAAAGIEQIINNNEQVYVYPNPANNRIYIGTKEIVEIKLYDLLGNEILTTKDNEIDVSGLTNGVYFIEVNTNGNNYTQKVIVQH